MTTSEIKSYVGKTIFIRGVQHVCVAAGDDQLLLLELNAEGFPIQYIVAHSPSLYQGELVWAAGNYFVVATYGTCEDGDPMIRALQDATLALQSNTLYVAMADDDAGCRCVGVFSHMDMAISALDKVVAQDSAAHSIAVTRGKEKLTYLEYRALYYNELSLYNAYWIDARRVNESEVDR